MSIQVRDMLPKELPFVLDGFLSSYRTSHFAGLIQFDDWWSVMAPQVEKMLARPGWRCLVVYDTTAEAGAGDLMGFAFGLPGEVLGYVYVKQPFRRYGMAWLLLRKLGIERDAQFRYVAKTPIVGKLLPKVPGARFDPLVARS